jgi:hypothetical protein
MQGVLGVLRGAASIFFFLKDCRVTPRGRGGGAHTCGKQGFQGFQGVLRLIFVFFERRFWETVGQVGRLREKGNRIDNRNSPSPPPMAGSST